MCLPITSLISILPSVSVHSSHTGLLPVPQTPQAYNFQIFELALSYVQKPPWFTFLTPSVLQSKYFLIILFGLFLKDCFFSFLPPPPKLFFFIALITSEPPTVLHKYRLHENRCFVQFAHCYILNGIQQVFKKYFLKMRACICTLLIYVRVSTSVQNVTDIIAYSLCSQGMYHLVGILRYRYIYTTRQNMIYDI